MKNIINRKNQGFTLIELLVVIAIIGILAAVVLVSLNSARAKSRDARRLADIRQVMTSLELFYNDCGNYPAAGGTTGTTVGLVSSVATNCPSGTTLGTFLTTIPQNPTPNGSAYTYTNPSASTYELTFTLEGVSGGFSSGIHTASQAGLQ